jgi:hypothetical protein
MKHKHRNRRRVNFLGISKATPESVLPDTHELESKEKPLLDLERLRRLADIARPLQARIASAESIPAQNSAESATVGEREQSGQSRSAAGPHRGAGADR